MVDHQVHGNQRLNHFGVTPESGNGGSHGCEVHQERHTGEILEHNSSDDEGNLDLGRSLRIPICERAHVVDGDLFAVAVAEHRLQNNPNGDGQPGNGSVTRSLQGW